MKKLSERPGYKWVIAGLCFLTFSVAIGFFYNTLALFLKPVTDELGIPRSLYAASTLTSTAASVVIGLIFGGIVARFRAKTILLTAVSGTVVATLVYAFARSAAAFFVFWFLEGSCLFFCSTTMISYVLGCWFTEHRSAVMGVVMAGSGIGTAVGTQVLRPIIIGQRAVFGFTGFRAASCVTAALLAALLLVILLFFRDAPEKQPEPSAKQDGVRDDVIWKTVRRSPLLYLVGLCFFLTNIAMHAPMFVNAAHMEDIGLDPTYLTNVVTAFAVALFFGKILVGFLCDRLGLTVAMTFCNLASVVSSVCLFLLSADAPGYALAHEILLGCAIPVETVLLPMIVSEMFDERCCAKIMGLYFALMCVGYAVGDLLTNGLFDLTHTYRPILLAYAGIMLLVAVAEPIVFAYGKRSRADVRETEASN